ncbi:MAG TPA: DUF423 domain-containing protein [Candidatus Eisenbacteria bacterium]|jgi:uncharacterized membrane protein YgdD (TMEM256/DUF423 family)|nr:DUF423 domain-containing protein [Candidatus Eisenbacteria bacterium]
MRAHPSLFGPLGAASGLIGVAAGAFGAHALRAVLAPDLLQAFETGSRYQIAHALALILTAMALERSGRAALAWAGWLFLAGQVLFSGSLYALALSGTRLWGVVTPFGGVCLLAGWLMLGVGLARGGERESGG